MGNKRLLRAFVYGDGIVVDIDEKEDNKWSFGYILDRKGYNLKNLITEIAKDFNLDCKKLLKAAKEDKKNG